MVTLGGKEGNRGDSSSTKLSLEGWFNVNHLLLTEVKIFIKYNFIWLHSCDTSIFLYLKSEVNQRVRSKVFGHTQGN